RAITPNSHSYNYCPGRTLRPCCHCQEPCRAISSDGAHHERRSFQGTVKTAIRQQEPRDHRSGMERCCCHLPNLGEARASP
ncbi:hypothetical protein CPLU01_10714, partial [Colletotrichum plurivorum]